MTKLLTKMGAVQVFKSASHVLAHYNRKSKTYAITTDEKGQKVLVHIGHKTTAGIIETE
jgi:hypothetical protein